MVHHVYTFKLLTTILFTYYIMNMLSNCILINVPKKCIMLPPEKMYNLILKRAREIILKKAYFKLHLLQCFKPLHK